MERLRRMTILIKYPKTNKKTEKDFFNRKDKELTNLDWAKWGGWFDTDGYFYSKGIHNIIGLKLKDKEPVELFCKTFETSFRYQEHNTVTPNGNHYIAKEYVGEIRGQKAIWFTKNISKYIFNKTTTVKNFLEKHKISYEYPLHTFTKDELMNYIVSALQGDGTFYDCNKNKHYITLYSANINYLKFIQNELNKHDVIFGGPYAGLVYKTKAGIKTQFQLNLGTKQRQKAIDFYETIIPKIEMTRKRENAIISLGYLKK
jgi:hypothetical protein